MRYRKLLVYWMAIGVGGMLAFRIPFAGFALGIGALLYFVYAIPYWLLFVVFFHQRPHDPLVFGMARRAFAIRLALGAAVVCIGSLLLGWNILACLGAAVLFYCGDVELKERMIAAARARPDPG